MTTTKEDPSGRQLLASRPITRASRVSFPPPQLRNPEKYESTSLAARALSFRPGPFGSRPTTYPSHRGTRWLISRVQKSARSVGRSSSSFSLSTSYLIVFPRLRASVTLAPPANPEAERLFSRPPARIRSRRLKKKKKKDEKVFDGRKLLGNCGSFLFFDIEITEFRPVRIVSIRYSKDPCIFSSLYIS